jgi:hypothetical protein
MEVAGSKLSSCISLALSDIDFFNSDWVIDGAVNSLTAYPLNFKNRGVRIHIKWRLLNMFLTGVSG